MKIRNFGSFSLYFYLLRFLPTILFFLFLSAGVHNQSAIKFL
ncbi:hypothetical protein KKH3_30950 [Pectobacterium actinidiae]|nr:hypothetical protein KKH3_30950 [Pectobacterium actinidiae]